MAEAENKPRTAARPGRAVRTEGPGLLSPRSRQTYLALYNFASAILWFSVLGRVLLLLPLAGWEHVHEGTGTFVKWTQTAALMEVGHSALGIVGAPIFTTGMQVASRILLVWGVQHNFPAVVESSPAYASMLLAWSITEVVRYSYFTMAIGGGGVPGWLAWLRYNTFYPLYPLGISSECWLIYKSIPPATAIHPILGYALYAILAAYIPGAYVLYTHMIKQRRRAMRGKQKAKAQ